ncbi:MAG: GNAT family N-acetyltransferase [Candidatus Kapabacteria bacterium]|nr:GNAT family N-acetyltransferase [Candidatus Kapabacteria bacterium]MBX7155593.1 GNAT family N-acetyltransferase [Bacteroidota bacterium]
MKYTSHLSLRPRKDTDTDFLKLLYETSRDEEFQYVEWVNSEERTKFFNQQFEAQQLHFLNNYDNLNYDIVVLHSTDIGRLVLHRTDSHVHCVDVIILPEYRKQGIGHYIMTQITNELDQKNITSSLYFEKTKPYLEKLYSSYGFVTTKDIGTHIYMERPKKLAM